MMHWLIVTAALLTAPDAPHVVAAVGIAGEPQYGAQFAATAEQWRSAAALGGATFTLIEPGDQQRDRLRDAITSAPRDGDAPLYIVLIGHGTWDGREAKFNLVGPDVSAGDLAQWLTPIKRPAAMINCASSSGPFLPELSAPGRIVVTATKSGDEVFITRFGGFFAKAFASFDADRDKDGQTSLLEAFIAASQRTAAWYEAEGRLATEHALIDDNGDKQGVRADNITTIPPPVSGAPIDGRAAHAICLVPSPLERALTAEQKQRRDALEAEVKRLQTQRDTMDADAYYAGLEPLLVELARLYHDARATLDDSATSPAVPR